MIDRINGLPKIKKYCTYNTTQIKRELCIVYSIVESIPNTSFAFEGLRDLMVFMTCDSVMLVRLKAGSTMVAGSTLPWFTWKTGLLGDFSHRVNKVVIEGLGYLIWLT